MDFPVTRPGSFEFRLTLLRAQDGYTWTMQCERCGEREAEIFQTQRVGDKSYHRDLCSICAKVDYGVFLGALLQSQAPGALPLTAEDEREVRRVLDEAAPPKDEN